MENFINFGLYLEPDADRLKQALENYGISVQTISSEITSTGLESSIDAGMSAVILLIPESKIESAEKIREELQIVRFNTSLSARSPYNTLNRYLFIVSFFSFFLVWIGVFSDQLFQSFHIFFINHASGIFFLAFGLIAVGLVTFLSAMVLFVYRLLMRRKSVEKSENPNTSDTRQ